MTTLRLDLRRRPTGEFSPLLQGGVMLEVAEGTSLRDLLEGLLELPREYIAGRVSTVFLDGEPVDDLESALVREGSSLALSAAMPGLVGGTMRRGGALAVMRSAVSHRPAGDTTGGRTVAVRVKLFNLLMEEIGPAMLSRGVLVPAPGLSRFLDRLPPSFWEQCRAAEWNGELLRPATAVSAKLKSETGPVRFEVRFEERK